MQYYMHINGVQVGPFEESDLMLNGLTPTTPVWTEGMTGWMPANQVAALAYLFAGQTPPPDYGYQPNPGYGPQPDNGFGSSNRPPMPSTNLVWGILVTMFCCLPLGVVSIVKASQVSGLYAQGRYDEAEAASKAASKWALWGAISSAVLMALYFFVIVVIGAAASLD